MRGRKVIFASIWPLLPHSLDCGQNIYRGTIKVIHRHRKSQPFQNSVKIKHGLSFFSSFHQNWATPSANCIQYVQSRFKDFLQLSCEALIDDPHHPSKFWFIWFTTGFSSKVTANTTYSRWAITAARGLFTRHADGNSGAVSITRGQNELHSFIWHTQRCQLLQRELEGLSMLEYKSFSDRRLFTDSHCSFTGPA